MRKLIYILLVCTLLGLAGCNSKEEAIAETREVLCEEAGVQFTLNGLWIDQSQETSDKEAQAERKVILDVYREETGSGIQIICEDLTKTEGGTLVRLDDYVADFQEQLKISDKYQYACGDISTEMLYGNSYETFSAVAEELNGKQQYYIRRQDDTMIIMVITVFEEDKKEDILALGKEM